ncbi:alpha/beta hydrolase, partial [Salmonella enterica subsp. enterica serovar Typhimurium]|nr:alpha/beta hydrolase [Salmonella enterica subsp. enterica serovar Typhimurium]
TESIDILGEPYYLAANFSASYGMWLAENRLDNVGYFNLLSKQQSLVLPHLFMLEPYDPNKRIIIMLHGLASSPATWISITNDISSDS